MSWMPEVMVTSPVPGKGLGCPSCLSQGLSSPSLSSHHCLLPHLPANLTRRRGGHGSRPVPQLWGDKSPVDLSAFLPNHTGAISDPQPWKRPEEFVCQTRCPATSHLSPTFLPRPPAALPLTLTALRVKSPGWNAGAHSQGTRLRGHWQGEVNGARERHLCAIAR